VLANLAGGESILWNLGDLNFEKRLLDSRGGTRSVTIVDVNSDGLLDIILTKQFAAPSYWQNMGNRTFEFVPLPGVDNYAYALDWADLDGDGDLDLVTGSYNAELERVLRDTFLFSDKGGVFYYENQGGQFVPTRLAEQSQALVVILTDLNNDHRPDIAVGNDFGLADGYWTHTQHGWQPFQPFTVTTHSTMSFDVGDINNNGRSEFFATDMNPIPGEARYMWQPILASIKPAEAQIVANVLQLPTPNHYVNQATQFGVAATGWSWSGKFGDLNSDGYLDLYVVNGMIAEDLLPDLPRHELVEKNQVYRNGQGREFIAAPEWKLDSTASGRGMSMADLDNDGDLDIVVNNLASPAQLFENQLCGGNNLIVELHHEEAANTYAIGAQLTLVTSTGAYTRTVHATSGYLSGDPARLHFGVPLDIQHLEIRWDDGEVTQLDSLVANQLVKVTRR
ncbi:MAG: CRTAC1 family protein, partial [Chloroflexi bacterium]|nr:CRTAC1 family protein [Chloroflexota bacterium]